MALPTITPTVPGIVALKNTPSDAEAANTLGQYVVQVKNFLASFLALGFTNDAQPLVLPAAIAASTLAGKVSGTTANTAGTQQGIVQGTVSTPDLRDGAVTSAKLAADTITTSNIAAATILGSNIAAATVDGSNIVSGGVGVAQLSATAVSGTGTGSLTPNIVAASIGTPELAAQAVTTAKIADLNVTLAKLVASATAGNILVASNTSPPVFTDVPMTGDVTIDYTGKTTVVKSGIIELVERAAANTVGGTSVATTWNPRGVNIGWTKIVDTLGSSFAVVTTGNASIVMSAGTYLITVSSPCYMGDMNQVRIVRYLMGGLVPSGMQQEIWGSSECSSSNASGLGTFPTAPSGTQTRSVASGVMTFSGGDFFQVEHYITTAAANIGLGVPVNAAAVAGETIYEIYAQVRIQQIG